MTAVQIVFSIIYFIAALVLIAIVMLQSGKSSGLGVIGGNNTETFMAKNKSKGLDAKLAKSTKWIALGFMVLTLIICFL